MLSELEEKTQCLTAMLGENGLDGVLLNAQHNFAWLTGGRSNGIDLSRENGASFLLVRADGKRFLIANNIELERLLLEDVSAEDFEPVKLSWQNEKASGDAFIDAARSLLPAGGDLATDLFLSSGVRPIESSVARCRYRLTGSEIERLRNLGRDAGEALGEVAGKVSPGETELEIARKLRDRLTAQNIYAVVTLVGADERIERYRHPVPTANVWKRNVLIAVCARREGLIVSLTRMITAGEISPELQRRTEVAAAVNAELYAATVEETSGARLYEIAEAAYEKNGFPDEIDKHHQGGACGYKTRDWVAHPVSRETVNMHQAFAWNPSITGTKVEETGIVTENGFEVVTATEGFPRIESTAGGRTFFSPGILLLSKGVSA